MPKVIMTVDDSRTMREMIGFTLKEAGYEVLEAEDGQDALGKLKSRQADIVITDLNMPNMDGLGLIRELRALSSYKSVPILMLTTEADETKKKQGREAGATGWVVKPFNPEKLVAVVKQVGG